MMGLNVTISDELARMIEAKVEAGEYASASEVVEAALRQLDMPQSIEFDADQIAWLRKAWEEGIASGPGREINFEEIKREGRRRLAQRS